MASVAEGTSAETPTLVDAAIELLSVGCAVVQVEPGEKRTVGRRKRLLRSPDEVTEAYRARPDAHLGVDLKASRLFDLDLDDREQRDRLDPLLAHVVTPTFTSIRGTHFLFAAAPSLTTNRNLQAADGIRAELRVNGIVVTPPSPGRLWIPDRSVVALGARFGDLSPDIARLFATADGSATGGPAPKIGADGDPIPHGARDDTLTSIVGSLFAHGLDEAAVLVRALETNRTRCRPPLSSREVERIVRSIGGREAATRSGGCRMSGLVRFTVNTATLLDGPASELDAATFGVLHRLLYQAWRKDGLPADIPTALRLVGASTTPALR